MHDDNGISIDGPLSIADSVDQVMRFTAAGWNAVHVDGHDQDAILAAIKVAQASEKPSFIACKTTIGFGAPKRAGTNKAHGEPLGAEEIAGARKALGWSSPPFVVPEDILSAWRRAGSRGQAARKTWEGLHAKLDPALRAEFDRRVKGDLPAGFDGVIAAYKQKLADEKPEMATRKSSEAALKVIAPALPGLIVGSADLTPSNNTKVESTADVVPGTYTGRYIHWGIREHGMAAASNGMVLHGGYIVSDATFLVFADYCRPAIRLAALMGIRVIHVFTHDSIGLGEDGPTHQPVEHLASLRAIPNVLVFRPADATETVECWQAAIEAKNSPSILALTRQNLPAVRTAMVGENLSAKGAYELSPAEGEAIVSIFASGSEIAIAMDAKKILTGKGLATRVVSVPCMDLFEQQDESYRAGVIGKAPIKIGVEAAIRQGWDAIIGSEGGFVGMSSFGASGPFKELYAHFGITPEAVAEAALKRHNAH